MLDIHRPDPASDTKTFFSHSTLPTYIDPLHTSTKKKPFTCFIAQPHTHTLDLALPPALWDLARTHLATQDTPTYARAWLKLGDVLADDFLDAYVRNGSASVLSAGRPRVDARFDVVDGVLRIEMDRPTYERAGLVGVAVEDGGRKHQRGCWRVEVDLKQPSMRKGKRAFERLRWAARNVLDESKSCLFWSANPSFGESVRAGREVLSRHAPKVLDMEPEVTELRGVVAPTLPVRDNALSGLYDQDDALSLLEWLDLLSLGSPRVNDGSDIDSHLCRYDVPDLGHGVQTRDLVRVRWSGFLTPPLIKTLFLAVWKAGYKAKHEPKRRKSNVVQADHDGDVSMDGAPKADASEWFSMSAQAFGGTHAWSLMQFASQDTLVWEVEASRGVC